MNYLKVELNYTNFYKLNFLINSILINRVPNFLFEKILIYKSFRFNKKVEE